MRQTGPRLLIYGVLVALAIAVIVFGFASHSNNGELAHPLPRQVLVGPTVTLAGLRGKPVFVVFWASWCGPCQKEAPAVERFANELRGRATLVGVNWNDPLLGNARSFIRRYRWSFPNLRDGEGLVGDDYGLSGLPMTFLIDSTGHVRRSLGGAQNQQTLERALSELKSAP